MNPTRTTFFRLASTVSVATLLAACGDTDRVGTDGGIISDPNVETLEISSDTGDEDVLVVGKQIKCGEGQVFSLEVIQVKAECVSVRTGKRRDVTKTVIWRPGDQNFLVANNADKKGTFTARCPLPHAGKQVISAEGECGRQAVEVPLTYVAPDVFAENVDKNIPNAFNGPLSPNIDDQPQIIYPLDAAMHAPNVGQIKVQWKDPGQHSYFKLTLKGDSIESSMYVGANGNICTPDNTDPMGMRKNCGWQPDARAWRTVSESAKGGQVTLTITGTAGAGALVAESPPITLNFSPEFVRGGFYYFSPSIQGLKRLPFGSPAATDFIKGGTGTPYECVGCHAISPDGKRVAATFFGADGLGGIVDAFSAKAISPPLSSPIKRWNFATFSPDGRLLLTNWAGQLELRDGITGARKKTIKSDITGGRAIQPDWSPDGNSVAFVQVPADGKIGKDFINGNLQAGDFVASNTGNIAVMRVNGEEFEPARVIVPSQPGLEYHYFPSWAPDSSFILFVTATAPGSSATAWGNVYGAKPVPNAYQNYVMTYDQDTARLRLVAAEGGKPIELTSATYQQGTTTSWPRFAPFKQGNLAFFTFSAKFPYGYVVTDGKTPQLWMSAVDLARATTDQGATDPSYPPFWLPFQDPKEKNHSGIWTTRIPCNNNNDCGEGFRCNDEKFCEPLVTG